MNGLSTGCCQTSRVLNHAMSMPREDILMEMEALDLPGPRRRRCWPLLPAGRCLQGLPEHGDGPHGYSAECIEAHDTSGGQRGHPRLSQSISNPVNSAGAWGIRCLPTSRKEIALAGMQLTLQSDLSRRDVPYCRCKRCAGRVCPERVKQACRPLLQDKNMGSAVTTAVTAWAAAILCLRLRIAALLILP